MLTSIWFIVTSIVALVGLMLFPHKENKENGVTRLAASVMILITWWVFAAGLINMLKLPVNILNLSWSNLLIALLAFLYIGKKKKFQKYFFSWKDAAMLAVLMVFTVVIGIVRYGVNFDVFAYSQDDSVRHFNYASGLVKTGNLPGGRYTLYLLNMIFIQLLDPVIGPENWHRAFLISEMFLFFAIGSMFWILIRTCIKDRYSWVVGIIMEFLFLLGYPLMNMLCGFEYLGSGILVCTWLLWILYQMEQEKLSDWLSVVLLMFANLAVCNSYTLFAPAILLGEFIYLIVLQIHRKKFYSLQSLFLFLFGFMVPGYICIWFIAMDYMNILLPLLLGLIGIMGVLLWINRWKILQKHNRIRTLLWIIGIVAVCYVAFQYILMGVVVNFMRADGSIYREPYGNFIIWLFPVVLFVIRNIRNKRLDAGVSMIFCVIAFGIWMLYSISMGKMGTYYFYKLHFLMWVLLFWCAFREISYTTGVGRKYLTIYLVIGFSGFCISLTGIEKSMQDTGDYMWPSDVSQSLFGVYKQNMESLKAGGNVTRDMQAIYNAVREVVDTQDTFVPYFGTELRYLKEYYYYLTNQNPENHPDYLNEGEYPSYDIYKDLEELGCKYIFVQKNYGAPYEEYKQVFDLFPVRFENDYGWLLKVE